MLAGRMSNFRAIRFDSSFRLRLVMPAILGSPKVPRRSSVRRDRWTVGAVEALFDLPFPELLFRAQEVHRAHHARNTVQLSTLLSIKTGGCPEDCGYCPQAARYHTNVTDEPLLDVAAVTAAARTATRAGTPNGLNAVARRAVARQIRAHARSAAWSVVALRDE